MNTGAGSGYPDMSAYYQQYNAPRPPPSAYGARYQHPQHAYQQQPPPVAHTFQLEVVQKPERAKLVSKDKSKDRKPIDPPPIIRCVHTDPMSAFNPLLFCSVTLVDAEKDEPKAAENSSVPLLLGSTVSSAHRLKSLNNHEGTYFVFGDLAPGAQGKCRLHFTLFTVDEKTTTELASIYSDPFDVSNAKDWDGVKESTVLSRTFADQGVKLRLRKESRNGRRGLQPNNYQVMPPNSQPPLPIMPQPTTEEDYDSDRRKRQRTSFSGDSYSSFPPSSQMGISGYQYSTADPQSYGQYASYAQAGQGNYSVPYGLSRASSTQSAPNYSPQSQQYAYRRPPAQQYYQQQAQQQTQYPGYPQQYASQSYAPSQSSSQQYSQGQGTPQQYSQGQTTPQTYGTQSTQSTQSHTEQSQQLPPMRFLGYPTGQDATASSNLASIPQYPPQRSGQNSFNPQDYQQDGSQ